jgi:hypothetical protein
LNDTKLILGACANGWHYKPISLGLGRSWKVISLTFALEDWQLYSRGRNLLVCKYITGARQRKKVGSN